MRIIATLILLFLAGSGINTSYAFTSPSSSSIKTTTQLSSYNDEYYRDYSNNANYNYNYNNNYNNNNRDNYVIDRNSGRFDNSVGSATYQLDRYGGGSASGYGSSRDYRSYDNYNPNGDYYRGGGGSRNNLYSSPYGRVGSSEDFRLTRRGGWGSDNMRRGIYGTNNYNRGGGRRMRDYNYGTTIGDNYYPNYYSNNDYYDNDGYYRDNYVLQNRRGGYADDIGGRSRYSTPLYTSGGYYNTQGLSEDFRVGREGPMSSITSRQRRMRNVYNTNRIQDYYTPGEREIMAQRDGNYGLRYGWQQQYNRDRGNVRRGSGEDFRRGSALNRISDYFTPLERERRQMRDNRESMGRRYDNGRGYLGSGRRDYDGGRRVGGYYEDYPDYGFDDDYYQDEYDDDDDYFDDDGGYSSGSRRRGRNGRRRNDGGAWSNLFNMFRN